MKDGCPVNDRLGWWQNWKAACDLECIKIFDFNYLLFQTRFASKTLGLKVSDWNAHLDGNLMIRFKWFLKPHFRFPSDYTDAPEEIMSSNVEVNVWKSFPKTQAKSALKHRMLQIVTRHLESQWDAAVDSLFQRVSKDFNAIIPPSRLNLMCSSRNVGQTNCPRQINCLFEHVQSLYSVRLFWCSHNVWQSVCDTQTPKSARSSQTLSMSHQHHFKITKNCVFLI